MRWLSTEFLLAVIITLGVALIFSWSGPPYPNHQSSREQPSKEAQHNQGQAQILPVQIDCDPNCTAKPADKGRHESRLSRFVDKTIDDPLAAFTAALAIATLLLVLTVLSQVRDAREASRHQLRAYLGHMSAHFESVHRKDDQAGSVKYFEINYGSTPALRTEMFRHIIRFQPEEQPPIPDDSLCTPVPLVQIVHPHQNFGSIVGPERRSDTFLLYGYVNYDDIFGGKWRRYFAFVHDGARPSGIEERWTAYPGHNSEEERQD